LGRQFDAGLAWVHFPVGCGGLGVEPGWQALVDDRLRAVGAPSAFFANPIGWGMGAPTVARHGSDAQRARYLRPLFTGEELWCQLFSEPGAGSDVAGLATRAVLDGDVWRVTGQKVWTSFAHVARWGMLLARTDPDAPKHRGLTYFVLDLHAPGVEVRPLRQMTGDAEFNEVYLTDVPVPDAERLGAVGDGWAVALTTLMNERVSLGGTVVLRGSGPIAKALDLYRSAGPRTARQRDTLIRLWVEAETIRLTNIRAGQRRTQGTPGPEGSIGKLASAEFNKKVTDFCMELMGAEAMLFPGFEMSRPPKHAGDIRRDFLRARANSIEGGTTEIMRNILGERVLGLPGDVRVDKSVSWSAIPRS
jgi:alkylation response protein AidB-like acyl-CoA dehydrogenase